MDKTAIKNFSIWARKALIRSVADKCGLVGVREDGIQEPLPQSTRDMQFFDAGTGAPASISGDEIKKRKALVQAIHDKHRDSDYKTAYNFIVEQVAYTWFNRLIAIRFMEVNDYLPSRIRVLSSEQEGKLEPDILSTPFDAEFDFTPQERDTVIQRKDRGQKEDMDALFRLLFVKQCDALHEILPNLFQKVDGHDYTELLLNISFTDRDGVIYHLVNDILESDFDVSHVDENGQTTGQVEIIGWAYQYYNTEPKAAVFAKKEKYTKEEIPAATQLFTPDWIVRYMVENSLGRLWVEGHLNDALKENWRYYLEEAEQEPEVQAQLAEIRKEYASLNPEDIKLIDPCMGSGHILVYAFDVLMQIYESQGYTQRDAAQSILANNLFGLDIDDRAAQLAYFAVMMKARQYDRRILTRGIQPHVLAIQESNGIPNAHLEYFGAGLSELEKNTARMQMENLLESLRDAKEYGSILRVENCDWELLRRFVAGVDVVSQITLDSIGVEDTAEKLMRLVDVGQELAQKYDVVVTNPPYMAVSNADAKVNDYVKKNFPDSKADLFAVFIERCGQMAKKNGYQAMITQHSWMFLSSFEKLRAKLLAVDIVNMAHLGARAFEEIGGEVVQTTSFVIRKSHIADYKGEYCRLIEPTSQQGKEDMFLAGENRYAADQSNFSKIPKARIGYWISNKMIGQFSKKPISKYADTRRGLQTGNSEKFIRKWYEVLRKKEALQLDQNTKKLPCKWFLFNSGGSFRRWYGNIIDVVNWEDSGRDIKNTGKAIIPSEDRYFDELISWNKISSGQMSVRYQPKGIIPGDASPFLHSTVQNHEIILYAMAMLNSKIAAAIVEVLSPTLNFEVGNIAEIPVVIDDNYQAQTLPIVNSCVEAAKSDWDSYETSWDFKRNPLVIGNSLSAAYAAWKQECEDRFQQLKQNEEELNRIFIDIYGLQDELTPEVADKDITVHRVFDNKDAVPESMKGSNYVRTMRDEIVSLISYAVGCMFGRYSLDVEGLAYAGGEWDASKYITFIPDEDNCIPVTDVEYFDDDIVGRFVEFLRTVYGEDTLEENLRFVADVLGGKGTTSREIIRNYFLNDFIKDHIKTYQKRPIYWMFDSGKQNGFKALIYMHRYDENTIGRIRADYLFRMQRAYENELKRTQDTIDSSTNAREVAQAEKRKEKLTKQLKETRDYDQKIAHLALARISIDLDDGVKANYEKIQTAPDGKKLAILTPIK